MDISQLQTVFQEGSEQSRLTQSLQGQKAALQEGKMPGSTDDSHARYLTPEQHDINNSLLSGNFQEESSFTRTQSERYDSISEHLDSRQQVSENPFLDEGQNAEKARPERLTDTEKSQLGDEYNSEVKKNSAGGDFESVDATDWQKIPDADLEKARVDYMRAKGQLIEEWEKSNGREWPRYEQDQYSQNGKQIRKGGDLYDAHHVRPLEFGGKNEVSNLTPIHCKDHFDKQGLHRPGGPYDQLAVDGRVAN